MRNVIISIFGSYAPIVVNGEAFVDWSYVAEVGLFALALWGLIIIIRSVVSQL